MASKSFAFVFIFFLTIYTISLPLSAVDTPPLEEKGTPASSKKRKVLPSELPPPSKKRKVLPSKLSIKAKATISQPSSNTDTPQQEDISQSSSKNRELQPSSLAGLPDEIWVNILKFADFEDLSAFSVVSLHSNKLAKEGCRQHVFKFYPQYGKNDKDLSLNEVKSPQHLLLLLERLRKNPINYKKLLVPHKQKNLIELIDAAFLPPKASHLKGVLFELGDKIKKAWHHYKIADKAGQPLAQKRVTQAIFFGELGQDQRPKTKRFKELKERDEKGDLEAKKRVNEALYTGVLGQDRRPMKARFGELNARTEQDDLDALLWVNKAILYGRLGQPKRDDEERLNIIYERGLKGDKNAQDLFAQQVDLSSSPQRLEQLRNLFAMGNMVAKDRLFRFIFFEQDLPNQVRFNELNTYAEKNDELANKWIMYAYYSGDLGRDKLTEKERWTHLWQCALNMNPAAQRWVLYAMFYGELGQDQIPELERFNYIAKQDSNNNIYANEMVNQCLFFGKLGQKRFSFQQRFNKLKGRANKGDKSAQKWLNKALVEGTRLGQGRRPVSERFREIENYAKGGSLDARFILYHAFLFGDLGKKQDIHLALVVRKYFMYFYNIVFLFSSDEHTIDLDKE